jgi:hypothetical protein
MLCDLRILCLEDAPQFVPPASDVLSDADLQRFSAAFAKIATAYFPDGLTRQIQGYVARGAIDEGLPSWCCWR